MDCLLPVGSRTSRTGKGDRRRPVGASQSGIAACGCRSDVSLTAERTETPVRGVGNSARPVRFACRWAWKISGDGAARSMVRTGVEPTGTDLAGPGPIGAVCDVMPGIGSGEITFEGRVRLTRCEIQDDFDAAIQAADRIAITKDGIVIQIGTPEELVIRPATDHVAEFTREVMRPAVFGQSRGDCGRTSGSRESRSTSGRGRPAIRRARRRRVATRRADAGRPDHRTDRPGPPLTAIVLTPSGARGK